jgi:hypothetical protein
VTAQRVRTVRKGELRGEPPSWAAPLAMRGWLRDEARAVRRRRAASILLGFAVGCAIAYGVASVLERLDARAMRLERDLDAFREAVARSREAVERERAAP